MAQAYLNEKKLDTEARQLQNNAANFSRQAQQWLQLVESFSSALKEVGDVDNWARSIEKDLKVAETALEYAYKVGPNSSWIVIFFVNKLFIQVQWLKILFITSSYFPVPVFL